MNKFPRFTTKHTMDELVNTIRNYYLKAEEDDAGEMFYDVFPKIVEKDLDIPMGFSEGCSLWEDFNTRYNDFEENPWEDSRNQEPEEYIKEFYEENDGYQQMENLYLYVKDGFPIIICNSNEDDEYPTFFIMYLDDKNNLRAYIPKKGNTFNPKTNRPYEADWDTGFENMHYELNLKKFLEDIKENITLI